MTINFCVVVVFRVHSDRSRTSASPGPRKDHAVSGIERSEATAQPVDCGDCD